MKKYDKLYITLLGESNVGKTSISYFHKEKTFDKSSFTDEIINSHFKKLKFVGDDEEYNFKIIDIPGQEQYKNISHTSIGISDGLLLIFSVDNMESFNKIKDWVKIINEKIVLKEKAIILVGNKIDTDKRKVEKEKAEELAKNLGIKYRETSAKTGEGIDEVFQDIYYEIYEKFKPNYFYYNENKINKLNKYMKY